MYKNASVLCMYAVTPCHAGSGSALGVVDNPIQRERHTNWPVIPASGMKGAMRAHFDRFKDCIKDEAKITQMEGLTDNIFGSENADDTGYAGSISVSDGKILAYPMRSNIAPFVWITCPAVIKRLCRDLSVTGTEIDILPDFANIIEESGAIVLNGTIPEEKILLEDFEVIAVTKDKIADFFTKLKPYFEKAEKLILVSDTVFDYGVSECTQISAQIKIDQKTGTTSEGSLRYQEELPADTLMYTVIFWGDSKNIKENLKEETIRDFISKEIISKHIQIGGDETLGRGIFELEWK